MSITLEEVRCKFCHSGNVIRYGNYKNIQRWWCKNCQRKFADNRALPRMKVASNITGSALDSYYDGKPLYIITKEITRKYRIYISDSTIFEWVDKFARKATNDNKSHHPEVGDTWIANETQVNIGGSDYWLIDIIDSDTQFIITTMLFNHLRMDGFNRLMKSAKDRVGKLPGSIIILGSEGFLINIGLKCTSGNKKIQPVILNKEKSMELMERIKSSYLIRNKVLSRLKKKENINKIIDGWLVHYNYRKVNEWLDGKTPAEKAGILVYPHNLAQPY